MNIYQENYFCVFNQNGFILGTKLNHCDFIRVKCLRVSPQQNATYVTWDNLTSFFFILDELIEKRTM